MGRTVADVAFLLSVIAGPDPRSPIAIDEPGSRFAAPLDCDFGGVRVAWATDLGRAALRCPRCGASSTRSAPPSRRSAALWRRRSRIFGTPTRCSKCCAPGCSRRSTPTWSRGRAGQIKDTMLEEVERGARLTGQQLSRAEAKRGQLYDRVRTFFDSLRVPGPAHHAGATFRRRAALRPAEIEGRAMDTLHRLDEVLLLHLDGGQSRRSRCPAASRRRACRSACRSSAGIGTNGASCSSHTHSSRRRASGHVARPWPGNPLLHTLTIARQDRASVAQV